MDVMPLIVGAPQGKCVGPLYDRTTALNEQWPLSKLNGQQWCDWHALNRRSTSVGVRLTAVGWETRLARTSWQLATVHEGAEVRGVEAGRMEDVLHKCLLLSSV
jgi:hypothetical protein